MSWIWLSLSCLIASLIANSLIRWFWLGLAASCLAGPLLFLLMARLITGHSDAFAGIVLVVGQVVAIPTAVLVGAGFRSFRSSGAA